MSEFEKPEIEKKASETSEFEKSEFEKFELDPKLLENLKNLKFSKPTEIQEKVIPLVLSSQDVAGLAQTGTGKTGAFLIPLLDRWLRSQGEARDRAFPNWRASHFILVLVPTRELADQVHENLEKFSRDFGLRSVVIYGGVGYDKQKQALKEGVDFVVATPGRLIDLYKEHLVDLKQVRAIVFDEADRMFDLGFKEDMKFILQRVPRERQFLVFSATLNFDVLNVAYQFGSQPIEVNVSKDSPKAENVRDEIFHVGQEDKPKFLLSLIRKHNPKQSIVFSNSKHLVDRIAQFLSRNQVPAMSISSLLSQSQRTRVLELFKAENEKNVLVATDVAARGLDIQGVDLVINYDLPQDPESYVHRIGRTGRAGQAGLAFSLVSDRDVESLTRIEEYLKHPLGVGWIEDGDLAKDLVEFPRENMGRFQERRGSDSRRSGDTRGPRSGPRPSRDRLSRGPEARSERRVSPDSAAASVKSPRPFTPRKPQEASAAGKPAHRGSLPAKSGTGSGQARTSKSSSTTSANAHSPRSPRPFKPMGKPGVSRSSSPPASPSSAASLTKKVKGLFQKLFGSKKATSPRLRSK